MANKIHKIYTGSKFYRYNEGCDEPEVIRIRNIDYDKGIVKYFDSNNKKNKMSYDDLTNKFKMLAPDGLISFSIVQVDKNPDVIVALKAFPKKEEDFKKMNDLPYAICRQMVADFFTNNFDPDDIILGVSVTQDTCPANIDFNLMLACTALYFSKMVAVYLDDTLEVILSLFDNSRFDSVFEELEKTYPNTKGIVNSLEVLLRTNNFMYDFRKCFNIIEVPFKIDEESEALSIINIDYLSRELKVNIVETYLVRYSRTIDFSKIRRDYVLVASAQDGFDKVYLVGYDKQ